MKTLRIKKVTVLKEELKIEEKGYYKNFNRLDHTALILSAKTYFFIFPQQWIPVQC